MSLSHFLIGAILFLSSKKEGYTAMFALKKTEAKSKIHIPETINCVDNCEDPQKMELRRQMYERIAQGNALSELEDKASHHWNK
jgi:hypothetical protein